MPPQVVFFLCVRQTIFEQGEAGELNEYLYIYIYMCDIVGHILTPQIPPRPPMFASHATTVIEIESITDQKNGQKKQRQLMLRFLHT